MVLKGEGGGGGEVLSAQVVVLLQLRSDRNDEEREFLFVQYMEVKNLDMQSRRV